ncbi:DUF262 domain-containing protein [Kushneria phosphatilytica]|uniref:DUF262 domain-containing protein n=1 Tax=Kushneria phosphatilytica TaxID=657387 RepID=A0A1S1NL38_9GAMM|nr:DUF262 domain-containing protein [Kushneria phosphatilytica]OHV07476.1 hypothetical protein BH688_14645 [Kushneria phosphatilytica]QEL09955.1 DUF262 domain-containing protein [Kushneria phosphatilytica]
MNISVDKTNLNNLLGVPNRQLTIPPYQRPYAWEVEQVDELWHDITDSLDESHFMGSVVLCSSDEQRPEVIDGQQRLTTIILLLALIRDRYQILSPGLVGRVQQFLENPYADPELRFKFQPGKANLRVFTDFVLHHPNSPARRQWDEIKELNGHELNRNSRLIANTERLKEYLDKYLQACTDPLNALDQIEHSIMKGLEFVVINVPDIANAFIIFETLNDRGLALSAGDLLKNHLLSEAAKARESVEALAEDWDIVIDNLEGGDITRFLRHYLLTTYSTVQKDDVFSLFKKEVSSRGVNRMIKDLKQMSRFYGQFIKPELVADKGVREIYQNLSTLRATMCYSALLAASAVLDFSTLRDFARLCEVLTFRYSTICSKDSKELERFYHGAAKALSTQGAAGLMDACHILESASPKSEEFVLAFRSQSMGRQYIVNYIFRHIENYLDPEEKTLESTQHVHIEHIMPQTLSAAWREDLGEAADQHELYVNRWGNLTLLGGKKNVSASNQTFAYKKALYSNSKIAMARELTQVENWGIQEIEDRQSRLAVLANTIWDFSTPLSNRAGLTG